jgi:hypothetical protein
MIDKPSMARMACLPVDFSNVRGQTERFWTYYRIGTRHYFPEHGIFVKKEEKEKINITSVCPKPHAHEQFEIKDHERARIKLQVNNQCSRISPQGLSLGKRPHSNRGREKS